MSHILTLDTQLRRDIYNHRRATSGIPNLHTATTARGQEACAHTTVQHTGIHLTNYYHKYHNTENNDCVRRTVVEQPRCGTRMKIAIDITLQRPSRT